MELRRTEKREIQGSTYEVTQLGAITGSKVFVRVLKLLGPVFTTKDTSKLFEALHEEDLTYLCNTFAPLTMVQGQGQLDKIFDVHFTGRYMAMLQWLFFNLELNFGDFLKGKGLGDVLGAVPQATTSSAPTQLSGAS